MKRHKKIEDQILKEFDKRMNVDLIYDDIIKDVDLSKYSSKAKTSKRYNLFAGASIALAFCSVLIISGVSIKNNMTDGNKDNANMSSSATKTETEISTPAMTSKNPLELEFESLSFENDSDFMTELDMYDVLGPNSESSFIYELNVSSKNTVAVAAYIEKEGYTICQKNLGYESNIIDGELLKHFYAKEMHYEHETKWIEIKLNSPVKLYLDNFHLAGLFVFDDIFIKNEILTSKQINKSYEYYRNIPLTIKDNETQFTNIKYERKEETLWCVAFEEVNFNYPTYFNNLMSKINFVSPLAIVKDDLITVKATGQENFELENQAKSCLESSDDVNNTCTYRYKDYCDCVRNYYEKKGK